MHVMIMTKRMDRNRIYNLNEYHKVQSKGGKERKS